MFGQGILPASRSSSAAAVAKKKSPAKKQAPEPPLISFRKNQVQPTEMALATRSVKPKMLENPQLFASLETGIKCLLIWDKLFLVAACLDTVIRVWMWVPSSIFVNKSSSSSTTPLVHPTFLLRGHTNVIDDLATFGQYLGSCSHDFTIRIWLKKADRSLSSIDSHGCLRGHTGAVVSIQFIPVSAPDIQDPQPRLLISSSEDKTLRLWNISTWTCTRIFSGHTNRITCFLVLGTSDTILLSGSADNTIRYWDMDQPLTSQLRSSTTTTATVVDEHCYRDHSSTIQNLVHLNDDAHFLSSSNDGSVKLINFLQHTVIQTWTSQSASPIYMLIAAPQLKYWIGGTSDGHVLVHSMAHPASIKINLLYDRQVLYPSPSVSTSSLPSENKVDSCCWISKGALGTRFFACVAGIDILCVWNLAEWEPIMTVKTQHQNIYCLDWITDHVLLSSGQDGQIQLWDIGARQKQHQQQLAYGYSVESVASAPPSLDKQDEVRYNGPEPE